MQASCPVQAPPALPDRPDLRVPLVPLALTEPMVRRGRKAIPVLPVPMALTAHKALRETPELTVQSDRKDRPERTEWKESV